MAPVHNLNASLGQGLCSKLHCSFKRKNNRQKPKEKKEKKTRMLLAFAAL
jgi:hypothetical protein